MIKKEPNVESRKLAFLIEDAESRRDSFVCSLSRETAAARSPTRIKTPLPSLHRRRAAEADGNVTGLPIIVRFDFSREIGWGGTFTDRAISNVFERLLKAHHFLDPYLRSGPLFERGAPSTAINVLCTGAIGGTDETDVRRRRPKRVQ